MSDDFDDLLTDDAAWCRTFQASLKILADLGTGQLALWPVDDHLAQKRYVPCPSRGLHARLVDCWPCCCDVTWGHAAAAEVLLAPGEAGGDA